MIFCKCLFYKKMRFRIFLTIIFLIREMLHQHNKQFCKMKLRLMMILSSFFQTFFWNTKKKSNHNNNNQIKHQWTSCATKIKQHTITRQSQRMIRILDLKLDKLFSSFWISHLPVKTHRNWVCNSSLTAFAKAREQRDQRDRSSSREKHNKKSKQYNIIDSHRFFVF